MQQSPLIYMASLSLTLVSHSQPCFKILSGRIPEISITYKMRAVLNRAISLLVSYCVLSRVWSITDVLLCPIQGWSITDVLLCPTQGVKHRCDQWIHAVYTICLLSHLLNISWVHCLWPCDLQWPEALKIMMLEANVRYFDFSTKTKNVCRSG